MAQVVVDPLETVEVHQHQRAAALVAFAGRQLLRELLLQVATIGQAGQRIVQGLVLEVVLGLGYHIALLLETRQHKVKILAEDAELVDRIDFEAFFEATVGNFARGPANRNYWPDDAAPDVVKQKRRHQHYQRQDSEQHRSQQVQLQAAQVIE